MTPTRSKTSLGWQTQGQGKDIILLRGLGRWSEHWCGFPEELACFFRVTTIDNRGFGMSKGAGVPWNLTIKLMAQDIFEVAEAAGLTKPSIMGVSLGGMIGMQTAALYPEYFSKLILVNTSFGGSPFQRITPAALKALSRGIWSPRTFYESLSNVLLGTAFAPESSKMLEEQWREIDQRHGLEPLKVLRQLIASARFQESSILANIKTPTMIIKGAADKFIDPRNSDWIAQRIKGSHIVTDQAGGHELAFERRAWLLKEVRAFLAT